MLSHVALYWLSVSQIRSWVALSSLVGCLFVRPTTATSPVIWHLVAIVFSLSCHVTSSLWSNVSKAKKSQGLFSKCLGICIFVIGHAMSPHHSAQKSLGSLFQGVRWSLFKGVFDFVIDFSLVRSGWLSGIVTHWLKFWNLVLTFETLITILTIDKLN